MIKASPKEICKYFLWVTALVLLYLQISSTRFLQDDYMVLGYLSNQSWLDWVSAVWQIQGAGQ